MDKASAENLRFCVKCRWHRKGLRFFRPQPKEFAHRCGHPEAYEWDNSYGLTTGVCRPVHDVCVFNRRAGEKSSFCGAEGAKWEPKPRPLAGLWRRLAGLLPRRKGARRG